MHPFIANVTSRAGTWGVEGTEEGITHIYLPNQQQRASKGAPPHVVASTVAQLEEYFHGARREFTVKLADANATTFQRDVWDALRRIPFGHVQTYAEVARATNRPRAHRAVGNANHANPWPIIVPCHRVVASTGLGGYGGGDTVKRFLLELEGVHYA
jgi:methylated-DNA-[protein]-cysteine S-methyltransferase